MERLRKIQEEFISRFADTWTFGECIDRFEIRNGMLVITSRRENGLRLKIFVGYDGNDCFVCWGEMDALDMTGKVPTAKMWEWLVEAFEETFQPITAEHFHLADDYSSIRIYHNDLDSWRAAIYWITKGHKT